MVDHIKKKVPFKRHYEQYTKWPTVPQIFIGGEFVGGCDIVTELNERGELKRLAG